MHIIFITDLHNHFEALPLLPAADLLVVGGDFTQLGSREDLLRAVDRVAALFPGFVAVGGNMDCPGADEILCAAGHGLSLEKTFVCGEARMRGCGGGNTSPFNTPFEWKDEDVIPALEAVPNGEINIFVSHAPAFATGADLIANGAHVGSAALAAFLRRGTPLLHLCGHIHEAAGLHELSAGNSTVRIVNPGPFGEDGHYAAICLNDGKITGLALKKCR